MPASPFCIPSPSLPKPCTKLELPWAFLDPSVLLYCGTSPDTVFTAPATSPNETPAPSLSSGPTSLLVLTNSSTGQKLRAPAHYVCCVTDHPPKRSALACCSRVRPRAFAATADDKFVESEVAPRVTPVAAARRSRPYPRAHPLLRIGDPSPYAPSPALPSVDPTVRRSYPLSFYKPKHSPEALVAIGTSLAGAQTTPPKTLLSSPYMKDFQNTPICSTFTSIPSA